ncbi:hypothetical protein [Arthrospiribacter ruber]|uniref:Uncharacterized protein n=1 Tax=Arthrospiribacter ruber TaxID=2487934 RepID=A0A951J0F5_9BACT|nr:hypothetical protein [Arthrospiribacter ruber]MBW3468678.1 hypothetical protein [Arthrospiribacter ruber]
MEKWKGVQLLQESWINDASSAIVHKKEDLKVKAKDSDRLQGHGYQLWRSRHKSNRTEGSNAHFILVLSEKSAVIVTSLIFLMRILIKHLYKELRKRTHFIK